MTKVMTSHGLEGIEKDVLLRLNDAKWERAGMGMRVPGKYDIDIQLFSLRERLGEAEEATIRLFVGDIMRNYVEESELQLLNSVEAYCTKIQRLFPGSQGDSIEWIIGNTDKIEQHLKKRFPSEQAYKDAKEKYARTGFDVDEAIAYLVSNAQEMKDARTKILPVIVERFPLANVNTIRHELDHMDFFNAVVYRNFLKREEKLEQEKADAKSKRMLLEEFPRATAEYVHEYCFVQSLLEGRALFFSNIPLSTWHTADFQVAEINVMSSLEGYFIEKVFSRVILEHLLAPLWIGGEINKDTVAYCRSFVRKHSVIDAMGYPYDDAQVDKGVADEILQAQLGVWKKECSALASYVVPILRKAFEEDPSRFKKAQTATTCEEFLQCCSLQSSDMGNCPPGTTR